MGLTKWEYIPFPSQYSCSLKIILTIKPNLNVLVRLYLKWRVCSKWKSQCNISRVIVSVFGHYKKIYIHFIWIQFQWIRSWIGPLKSSEDSLTNGIVEFDSTSYGKHFEVSTYRLFVYYSYWNATPTIKKLLSSNNHTYMHLFIKVGHAR